MASWRNVAAPPFIDSLLSVSKKISLDFLLIFPPPEKVGYIWVGRIFEFVNLIWARLLRYWLFYLSLLLSNCETKIYKMSRDLSSVPFKKTFLFDEINFLMLIDFSVIINYKLFQRHPLLYMNIPCLIPEAATKMFVDIRVTASFLAN